MKFQLANRRDVHLLLQPKHERGVDFLGSRRKGVFESGLQIAVDDFAFRISLSAAYRRIFRSVVACDARKILLSDGKLTLTRTCDSSAVQS